MRSLTYWTDLEDGHLYNEGDEYPHDGRKVSPDRIRELSSSMNRAGFPLIEAESPEKPKKNAK